MDTRAKRLIMILDIDVGNTRIKWRALQGDKPIAAGVDALDETALLDNIEQAILSKGADPFIKRVRIASVRDSEQLNTLTANILHKWQVTAEFAETTSSACGLQNSYAKPSTMGVDRWCGVIAAAHLSSVSVSNVPFCVIDAGSALTLDFVSAQGVHQGGHIAPGYAMQLKSLLGGTDRVFVNTTAEQSLKPADNTGDAVLSGVLLGMTGLIESTLRAFVAGAEDGVAVIITGGDAEMLQQHLAITLQHEPDLVLNGLARLLP